MENNSLTDSIDFNTPLHKYAGLSVATADHLSVPETIMHGAVATIADIGTTVWNSLTPQSMEVETADLLSRIDKDAMNVYQEHPDTIRALSFIGGSVLPMGLAMKGMSALRAGAKGTSWFSDTYKASKLTFVENAFKMAGPVNEAFSVAKYSLYRNIAANAMVDSIAAEGALYSLMNAHPWMEDYSKDLASNFAFYAVLGGGIGTGLGVVGAKYQISKLISAVDSEWVSPIANILKQNREATPISKFSHAAEQVAAEVKIVDDIQAYLDKAEKGAGGLTISPYSTQALKDVITKKRSGLVNLMRDSTSGELKTFLETAPEESKQYLIDFLARAENAGVDKVSYAKVKSQFAGVEMPGTLSDKIGSLVKTVIKKGQQVEAPADAYYSGAFGRYFSSADGVNYMTAADLGKDIGFFKSMGKNFSGANTRRDIGITLEVEHSANVDAEHISTFLGVHKLSAKDFENLHIHPEDLPTLNAAFIRASSTGEKINFTVTSNAPSYTAQTRLALKRQGLNPDYVQQLGALEKGWKEFSLHNHNRSAVGAVSREAETALANWISGSYSFLRDGAAVLRRLVKTSSLANSQAANKAASLIEEIQASAQTAKLKQALGKMADPDGFVWLYRGMREEPKGHLPIESYAITPYKAAEFGKANPNAVKLYKVHLDDIIGTVQDFSPNGALHPEILAFPPTRDFYQISKNALHKMPEELLLPTEQAVETAATTATGVTKITNIDELGNYVLNAQLQTTINLQKSGYGIEAIALRTGAPVDTIEKRILSGNSGQAIDGIKYTNETDILDAIGRDRRTLQLVTNTKKNLDSAIKQNLNAKGLAQISSDIAEYHLLTAETEFVRNIGIAYGSSDIKSLTRALKEEIGIAMPSGIMSTFFTSANQVLSRFPALAQIATVMGKESVALRNNVKELFEKPISDKMATVLRSEADLIEANTALNLMASTTGFRWYKARQFWTFRPGITNKEILELSKLSDADFLATVAQVDKNGAAMAAPLKFQGKEFAIRAESVNELMGMLQTYGRHMYDIHNTYNVAVGRAALSDIGFWTPAINFSDKEVAYVFNPHTQRTSMIVGNTPAEINKAAAEYAETVYAESGHRVKIITKNMQEDYNNIVGRHDPMTMEIADITKKHGGSAASPFVSTSSQGFQDLLSGYAGYINKGIDRLLDLRMQDTMDHLYSLSAVSQMGYNKARINQITKLANQPTDPGMVLRNIILGYNNLNQVKWWSEFQQRSQVITDVLLNKIADVFLPIVGKNIRDETTWAKVVEEMKAKDQLFPFDNKAFAMNRYISEGSSASPQMTKRAIALFNGATATLLIRFLELGQPLVNAMALPILTNGAVRRELAASFMGAELNPNAKFTVFKSMTDGVRLIFHPTEGPLISKILKDKNIAKPELRAITEMMDMIRSADTGLLKTGEDLLESNLVKWLSKPSDLSEQMVRHVSFATGWGIAKRAYPTLGVEGRTTFARAFMDEAIGNYTSSQRAGVFQGTFGTAMGLFQTYFLTMAQQLYRGIERKDWIGIAKQMLTQGTIFGAASLPGFKQVSESIATHFSDNHIDLETGTFRAIPDTAANILLYGLPSVIGPGVWTRGDIQPRLPNPIQGINSVAAVNVLGQGFTLAERLTKAAWSIDENKGRAMLEALSLQSISRPIARVSEIFSGTALTGAGNQVATAEQIYTPLGIISRVFATRPLEEIKAREMLQKDSFYKAYDRDRTKAVAQRLKSHIRSGELDSGTLEKYAYEYMRFGSPTGWRSAVNEALTQRAETGSNTVIRKLRPDSPLHMMIDDLEGGE